MPHRLAHFATVLLRTGADLRLNRLAVASAIGNRPHDAPGRDLALAFLHAGAWVDTVLLWAGWRLYPSDILIGR